MTTNEKGGWSLSRRGGRYRGQNCEAGLQAAPFPIGIPVQLLAANPAPCQCAWEKQQEMAHAVGVLESPQETPVAGDPGPPMLAAISGNELYMTSLSSSPLSFYTSNKQNKS